MSTIKTDSQHYTDIANAIREKTGTETTYKPSEMSVGVEEVYDAGCAQAESKFWDIVQRNGERADYSHAFKLWNSEYIRPKYKVAPTSGRVNRIFYNCKKLISVEPEYFDFSEIQVYSTTQTNMSNGNEYVFAYCYALKELPDVGLPAGCYTHTFYDCTSLKKIEVVRVEESTVFNDYAFGYCAALENITFQGIIGRSINFKWSPLTIDSLKGIITHLKDHAGTDKEYTYTVTFKTSVFEALEAEGATSPNGNTWAEYIDDLKWNLVTA